MPSFPIIDSHVHLYDPARLSYPWMRDIAKLNKRHEMDTFDALRGDVEVEGLVFVEVDVAQPQQLDEARYVSGLAERDPRIRGLVAAAPLEQGAAVEGLLEQLVRENPLLRGVRRLIQTQPDPEFCLRPGFIEGVKRLAAFDLGFDICILHHQLPATLEFVRRCPEVRMVLDHIGKPGIKAGLVEPWRAQIREMAALPNVVCKISGVATEADHQNWTREQLLPYIEHVIECFGFDRIMFGGDWPVSELASSYRNWVDTVDWVVEGATEEEKRKLYRDNAIAWYRLG